MKRLIFLFCAFVALVGTVTLFTNGQGGNVPIDNIVEYDSYVVGEDVSIADLQEEDANSIIMFACINDGQKERAGIYEKPLALESGKSYYKLRDDGHLSRGSAIDYYDSTFTYFT